MNVSQGTDKKQFYQPAVETISLILGLPACIWLADEARSTLKIVAATELPDEYIRKASLRLDEPSVASEVFKAGETIVVPDIASDGRWQYRSDAAAMRLKSAIVVPLRVEEKIVGVLDVYTHEVRDFSDFEKILIEKLAAQMVTSDIRNDWLLEQATNRAEALQKLHQIGGQILSAEFSAQGLEEVLRQVAQSAKDVLDADLVDVYRYVETEDHWILPPVIAGKRIGPEVVKDKIFEDDVVVQVIKRGKPLYTPDVQSASLLTGRFTVKRPQRPEKRFVVREGILSSAAVPLKAADETVGAMFVNYRKQQDFTPDQKDIIELFANQAALAIYNARVYEQTQIRLQERVDDIGALQDIYALIGTASLKKVLEQIAEEAARLTPAKYTGVWLVDERKHELRFGAMNERGSAPTRDWSKISLDEDSINTHVVKTGKRYRCDDVKKDRYYQMWYEDVRSELTVPLKYSGRVIGTLNLESTRIGAFTDDHVRLVEALAEAAAVAIHSARLYDAIQIVNEVGQALTSGIRLREDEILKLIHDQAGILMDTDNMYIALYDEAMDIVRFGLAFVGNERVNVETEDGWQPRRAGKGKTEEIIRTRRPIFHATRAEAKAWYTQPGHEEYVGAVLPSWMGVPMMVGGKVLGVIATYHPTRDHTYSGDDLAILQALASQAAIALDNARLYYNVNPRLQVLLKVGQTLSSGIQLKKSEILKLIYEQAQELTGTRDMYVALYDQDTEEISFELAMDDGVPVEVGIGGWATRKANMQERGKTEEIILTGKPILHSIFQESQDWYKHPGRKEFLDRVQASYLAVPMSTGDKILGVLAIYDWEREYAYSESDQAILLSMAGQAAIALENARLYEELHLQLERKKGDILASREIDRAIADRIRPGPELQNVLELILDKALERTKTSSGNIMWYDEVAGDLVMRAGRGVLEGKEGSRQNIGEGIVGLVAQERKTYRVGNVHEVPWKGTYIPFISNVRSELATPLLDAETLLGVLNVEDSRVDAFDEEDVRWLEDLAVRAVIAIRGAEAYEALQKEQRKNMAAGRLATVNAVASGFVHRMNNVAGTIPVRVGQIKELLDQNDVHYAKIAHYLKAINEDVDGILKTAQAIRTSKTEEPLELVDVDTLVSTALQRIVVPSRVTVCNRCDGNLPQVLVFSGQLVNTLENLIRNGIEAIDGSGTVTITCGALVKDGQEWVMIGVEDTGHGIAPADLDRIFDLFYSTKSGGMGFALWRARTLVESLGGRIEVSSEPGKGTTFTILLPVEKGAQK